MEDVLGNLSKKILDKISVEEQEYIIVAYGIRQLILIILNIIMVIIWGILWRELLFSTAFFLWFAVLRPFAGGYHADTELRCYGMSVVILNIILICKKYILLSVQQYLVVGFISIVLILALAPVENRSNPLGENEIRIYKKNTRIIVIIFSVVMFVSMFVRIEMFYSSIVYSLFLVCISLLAGKIKYRGSIVEG